MLGHIQQAPHRVPRGHFAQLRLSGRATLDRARAAPDEAAAGKGAIQARNGAGDGGPRLADCGSAPNNRRAYGWRGSEKNSAASASSTTWPAYISATRCAICDTTA